MPPARPRPITTPCLGLTRSLGQATRLLAIVLALLVGASALSIGSTGALAQGDQGLQGGWAVDDSGNVVFTHSVANQLPLMQQSGAGWVRINFRLGGCFQD